MVISLFVELAVPDRKKIRPQILRKSIPKLFPVPVYREKSIDEKQTFPIFFHEKDVYRVDDSKFPVDSTINGEF